MTFFMNDKTTIQETGRKKADRHALKEEKKKMPRKKSE
jgi:hypothetical protein